MNKKEIEDARDLMYKNRDSFVNQETSFRGCRTLGVDLVNRCNELLNHIEKLSSEGNPNKEGNQPELTEGDKEEYPSVQIANDSAILACLKSIQILSDKIPDLALDHHSRQVSTISSLADTIIKLRQDYKHS